MSELYQSYYDNATPVILVDYHYHTKEHPFCWDETCPCHTDEEAVRQVQEDYMNGLLSAGEVELLCKGKTL